jgi:hypothetical protein
MLRYSIWLWDVRGLTASEQLVEIAHAQHYGMAILILQALRPHYDATCELRIIDRKIRKGTPVVMSAKGTMLNQPDPRARVLIEEAGLALEDMTEDDLEAIATFARAAAPPVQ